MKEVKVKSRKRLIDKVTTEDLKAVLKILKIKLSYEDVDMIIDAVELLETHGDKVTLEQIKKINSDSCEQFSFDISIDDFYKSLSEQECKDSQCN
jgi:hypothetical protein